MERPVHWHLPCGEPFANQRVSGYNERFTFTGKAPRKGKRIPLNTIKNNEQRDEETGYGYFGARYMDHELMTMWLSVDSMADKYPKLSAYQTQAAYDANSLPRNQHPVLTIVWLTSIQKPDGSSLYDNLGKVRYDGDSDCTRIKQAFPNYTYTWSGPFSSLKGTYFKPKKNTP